MISGQLNHERIRLSGCKKPKVAVLGASGGVGTMAVQILLSENCDVVATCSTDAVALLERLGVGKIIDYINDDNDLQFVEEGPYDLIVSSLLTIINHIRTYFKYVFIKLF